MKTKKTIKPEDRPLTTKQQVFVEEYVSNGFNATMAALAAGYKGNKITLASVGSENLRKPNVRAHRDAILAEDGEKRDYTRAKAHQELDVVHEAAMEKNDLPSANQSIKQKCRVYGLDVDRVEHIFPGSKPPPCPENAVDRSRQRFGKQVECKELTHNTRYKSGKEPGKPQETNSKEPATMPSTVEIESKIEPDNGHEDPPGGVFARDNEDL